jgi:hypothetical protein
VGLVPSFTDLLQPLSCVMTALSFQSFITLTAGWVFARRRTVTGMILAAEAVGTKHHSAYHRLFAAARWSLDELGLAVFALVLSLVEGVVLLAIDDTLARKRGLKIFGVGMHHDPLLRPAVVRRAEEREGVLRHRLVLAVEVRPNEPGMALEPSLVRAGYAAAARCV